MNEHPARLIKAKSCARKTRTASVFIRSVLAIGFVVAEKGLVDTFSVTAREFTIRADGLVSLQLGQSLAGS
jgi:hypothetical protein